MNDRDTSLAELRVAIVNADRVFLAHAHDAELGDIDMPRIVSSLSYLLAISLNEGRDPADQQRTDDQLRAAFDRAYNACRAPGDFGYGTPCGEALRYLYAAWNCWCEPGNESFRDALRIAKQYQALFSVEAHR